MWVILDKGSCCLEAVGKIVSVFSFFVDGSRGTGLRAGLTVSGLGFRVQGLGGAFLLALSGLRCVDLPATSRSHQDPSTVELRKVEVPESMPFPPRPNLEHKSFRGLFFEVFVRA